MTIGRNSSTSIHWIIRFGAMLKSYQEQESVTGTKTVPEFKMEFSFYRAAWNADAV